VILAEYEEGEGSRGELVGEEPEVLESLQPTRNDAIKAAMIKAKISFFTIFLCISFQTTYPGFWKFP